VLHETIKWKTLVAGCNQNIIVLHDVTSCRQWSFQWFPSVCTDGWHDSTLKEIKIALLPCP